MNELLTYNLWLREFARIQGEIADICYYSILRSEYDL